ncbi:MAG TPA: DUF1587 domain-containing protein, partial [Myxococcota bacterium]|nr:DUF1587 domain-containing protein [Myxococcota bacterium]
MGLLIACGEPTEPEGAPQPTAEPAAQLPEARLRRLTQAEYRQTIADLFGEGVLLPASIEPDQAQGGLVSIGAATSAISPRGVEQYEDAAYQIADQVLAAGPSRDALLPCQPAAVVDA